MNSLAVPVAKPLILKRLAPPTTGLFTDQGVQKRHCIVAQHWPRVCGDLSCSWFPFVHFPMVSIMPQCQCRGCMNFPSPAHSIIHSFLLPLLRFLSSTSSVPAPIPLLSPPTGCPSARPSYGVVQCSTSDHPQGEDSHRISDSPPVLWFGNSRPSS